MAVMRVRRMAQVVLPAEVQRALNVQEGDFLEAEIVKDGVLLKPLGVVQRKRAWERMMQAASHVKDLEPNPDEDISAEEERIAEDIKAMRRERGHA